MEVADAHARTGALYQQQVSVTQKRDEKRMDPV